MKAKCIRELRIDGYRFEPGKEYDIEWHAFTRDADERDPVLARGYKVRHIQYAVKYDMLVPLPFHKQGTEKTPATLFLYDRQYCEHEDYTAPAIEPFGWTADGPLLCFGDFFEEVSDGMSNKPFFTPDILDMAAQKPDWPRGTEVVVYARKEDREKVLMVISQKGYVVTKFVEVSGLQAELMGEGRFIAAMADALRQKPVLSLLSRQGMARPYAEQCHLPVKRTPRPNEGLLPDVDRPDARRHTPVGLAKPEQGARD